MAFITKRAMWPRTMLVSTPEATALDLVHRAAQGWSPEQRGDRADGPLDLAPDGSLLFSRAAPHAILRFARGSLRANSSRRTEVC